jgi:vacuolar-type H+-ATPase subunit I/STV1
MQDKAGRMESYEIHAERIRAVLQAMAEMKSELERIAEAVDFTPEDWQYMYSNHRALANMLSAINFKYGPE